jgi:hypothetical protein
MRASWLLVLLLFACESPAIIKKEAPSKNSIATAEEFPWYVGFFRGEGREKLALLPDNRMFYSPANAFSVLGTFTIKDNDLTFTSGSGDVIQAKLTQTKDNFVVLVFDGHESKLKREVSFSRYRSAGTPKEVTLSLLLGTWKKVAQAGAPLKDWQKASDALGPSLASEEMLVFSSSDSLTLKIGDISRQEKFTLENQMLLRTPEGAGYQDKKEIRLVAGQLEIGPKEAPDIYIKQ